MSRFWYGLYIVCVAIITGLLIRVTVSHPPHVEPPVAEVFGPMPLVVSGAVYPGDVIERFRVFVEELIRAEESLVAVGKRTVPPVVVTGDCEGFVLPTEIVWRESKCQRLGDSANGYYGAYQIGALHWGPGGVCADLSWDIPAQEDECALRLWNDGAGARHWGA